MRSLSALRTIVIVLVTASLTSLFWITVYSGTGGSSSAPPPEDTAEIVADLPPGKTVTATTGNENQLVIAPTGLAIPVAGKTPRDLVDTYTASRSGGARVHNAIDIMADRGTPVIAAAPGTIEKLHFSAGGGGISAYVRSDDGQWIYYYAHLDAYAPGLAVGQRVARGTPLGTVGFTGNASPEGPHLHFAVHWMASGESWHEGTPVNPYPLLTSR